MISKTKIKEIIDLMEGTDIGEIEITAEKDKNKIRISKMNYVSAKRAAAPVQAQGVTVSNQGPPEETTALDNAQKPTDEIKTNLLDVKAPLVGTFYASPKPEDPVFVNVGDIIRVGQTVCIIEAMKIFNEIESEVAGKVVQILAANEDPVEYGQTLMVVEPV